MPETVMQYEEWLAEGRRRFGEDFGQWKFVCPICKNVAAVDDFKPYKDKGATPDSATNECIGRYIPGSMAAFEKSKRTKGPCDYAGYGLFRLSPVHIVRHDPKKPTHCFAFAEATPSA